MSRRAIIQPEDDFVFLFPDYEGEGGTFSTGTSSTKDVSRFDMATAAVQFSITNGGEYTLEGSVDGATFISLVSGVTASQVFNFGLPPHNHFWRYLRVEVVTAGVGDSVTLGAHEFLGHGG